MAALPTFAQSAALIGIHASGVGRAVSRLGIEPIRWGNRDKHLSVVDLLRLAQDAHREAPETVAGRLLEHVNRAHPQQVRAIQAEIDAFFAGNGGTVTQLAAPSPAPKSGSGAVESEAGRPEARQAEPEAEQAEPEQLRGPVEPDTARRLVALYTLPASDEAADSDTDT